MARQGSTADNPGMPRPITPQAAAAALPDFAFAAVCLIAWVRPDLLLENSLTYIMLAMLLEFIVVHSAAFLGTVMFSAGDPRKKAMGMLALGGFYTLFVGGFSLGFKTWWPLVSFWGLMLNRLMSVLVGHAPSVDQKALVQRGWAVSAMAYLFGCFVTVLLPIPRLGITSEIVSRANLPGDGLWVDQPWRVVAFGFLYFAAVGWSELYDHRWAKAGMPQGRGRNTREAA